jgi:hypothetical protein
MLEKYKDMPGLGEVSQDLAEFKRQVMAMHSAEERLEGLPSEDLARVLRTLPQAELDHLFQLLKATRS